MAQSPGAGIGAVAFIVLFLAVWLTFWTIGGVAAMTHLVRSLWGEDSIALTPDGFELVRRAGPFRRRDAFDRTAVRRIRLRPHDKAVVMEGDKGMRVLSTFGSPLERQEVADWLIRSLSLPDEAALAAAATPPATWDVADNGSDVRLCKVQSRGRVIRSLIAWILTALVSVTWIPSPVETFPSRLPLIVITLLLACGAALSTWSRREWIVRRGSLTFRWSVLAWASERTFEHAQLEIAHRNDSDNDDHYDLVVVDGGGRRTVHTQINDSAEVVDLGYWLAARTGFRFTQPPLLRPRADVRA